MTEKETPVTKHPFVTPSRVEAIARVCHEANRAYCLGLGDASQVPWDDAPAWQRRSAISGARAALKDPGMTSEKSHAGWCREKKAAGWTYGPEKDDVRLTHPCLVPYKDLPEEQRRKDALFLAVVRALSQEM